VICGVGALDKPASRRFFVSMKSLLTSLGAALLVSIGMSLSAAEPASVTYEGRISGVVCVSCKDHVTMSLMKKLPFIESVQVKNDPQNPAAEEKRLIIVAKSGEALTREIAMDALGSFAKNYSITSLERKTASAAP